jgi:hypothetical protein
MILDPAAVIPPRVTTYRRDPGYWLDDPGVSHRDFRSVDPVFGERIIAGLRGLPVRSRGDET